MTGQDPLIEALNTFAGSYRRELTGAMLARLGLEPRTPDEDTDLVNAAFRALAAGGEALRWEPFFFDWFCKDEARAMSGPRGDIYRDEGFAEFRRLLAPYLPERPERLAADYFRRPEPEELLYDEIEAMWAPIAADDDWTGFDAKLARLELARQAYDLRV